MLARRKQREQFEMFEIDFCHPWFAVHNAVRFDAANCDVLVYLPVNGLKSWFLILRQFLFLVDEPSMRKSWSFLSIKCS
jgi:hypothetical protein